MSQLTFSEVASTGVAVTFSGGATRVLNIASAISVAHALSEYALKVYAVLPSRFSMLARLVAAATAVQAPAGAGEVRLYHHWPEWWPIVRETALSEWTSAVRVTAGCVGVPFASSERGPVRLLASAACTTTAYSVPAVRPVIVWLAPVTDVLGAWAKSCSAVLHVTTYRAAPVTAVQPTSSALPADAADAVTPVTLSRPDAASVASPDQGPAPPVFAARTRTVYRSQATRPEIV